MAIHAPEPMHELQDHHEEWVIFERFLNGFSIPLPVIPLPGGYQIRITKFMLLELLAAGIIIAIFVPLAKKIRTGALPTGPFWNLFESLFVFIRDEIARPNLDDPHPHHAEEGHGEHAHAPAVPEHEGDKYVPFLATLFFFVLTCNLLGLIPFLGSPTASIWVTAALALFSFAMMHGAAIVKVGPIHYVKSLWPKIEIAPNPWKAAESSRPGIGAIVGWVVGSLFGLVICALIFTIELAGTVIKAGVLALRLFANMFAGHMSLAIILLFVWVAGSIDLVNYTVWGGVSLITMLGVVALSLLELFVALLQAYIFTFLTALFMGLSLYPEH